MGAILLAVPAGIYLSLAMLPKGRAALGGIAVAFAASHVLWWINVPEDGSGPIAMLIRLAQIAMIMAAIVQGVRTFLQPQAQAWLYPAIVAAGLVGGALMVTGGAV
jgi:uncharacterized membrane-anchored protein